MIICYKLSITNLRTKIEKQIIAGATQMMVGFGYAYGAVSCKNWRDEERNFL